MMTHHVITILLMAWSYFYNFTRAGCLIIVIMDYCDIFLPVSDPSIIDPLYLITTIAGQNVSLPIAEQALWRNVRLVSSLLVGHSSWPISRCDQIGLYGPSEIHKLGMGPRTWPVYILWNLVGVCWNAGSSAGNWSTNLVRERTG